MVIILKKLLYLLGYGNLILQSDLVNRIELYYATLMLTPNEETLFVCVVLIYFHFKILIFNLKLKKLNIHLLGMEVTKFC